jgi:DNA-binding NtrC family response regulator
MAANSAFMGNGTILVIDDEAEQRASMRDTLRQGGFSVLEAADYEEALVVQAGHLGEIVLILSDVRLPGGNAYDLSKALLAVEPHLKLLFTSGQAGAELCKFFDMPLTDLHFLEKPFESNELLKRVRTLLGWGSPFAFACGTA